MMLYANDFRLKSPYFSGTITGGMTVKNKFLSLFFV